MLITKKQLYTFWSEWAAVIRLFKWDHAEAERQRKLMLKRAGFESLTQVDKLGGLDRVLSEIRAMSHPSDLDGQLALQEMPRTRLIYAIRKMADEPYIEAVAYDRFHSTDWPHLSVPELEQLRFTIADRQVVLRRTGTATDRAIKAQARKSAAPEPRIQFPSVPSVSSVPSQELSPVELSTEDPY